MPYPAFRRRLRCAVRPKHPTATNFVFARSETSRPRLCAADGAALPCQTIHFMDAPHPNNRFHRSKQFPLEDAEAGKDYLVSAKEAWWSASVGWTHMLAILSGNCYVQGNTILLATHFVEEAERLCNRLCVLENGCRIPEGRPNSLIDEQIGCDVIEMYVAHPVS